MTGDCLGEGFTVEQFFPLAAQQGPQPVPPCDQGECWQTPTTYMHPGTKRVYNRCAGGGHAAP